MLYAILCEDVPGSGALRRKARPDHLARLEVLANEGRLILAGPHPAIDADDPGDPGFTGSLIVADFPGFAEAEAWAAADPYRREGVYERVVVKPFKRVFPR